MRILIPLIAFVGISCGGKPVSVMDVAKVKPPNADFAISERAIADKTFGEVTFSSTKGTRIHFQVVPDPPVTEDTTSVVTGNIEVYGRFLTTRPNSCGTFKYRGQEVHWYGFKEKTLSPKGEVVAQIKVGAKYLIATVRGGEGTEFSESTAKLIVQLFDANSEATSLR